jgi:hypothetical protein
VTLQVDAGQGASQIRGWLYDIDTPTQTGSPAEEFTLQGRTGSASLRSASVGRTYEVVINVVWSGLLVRGEETHAFRLKIEATAETTPAYTAPPSPRRYPVGTPAEVLSGLATDAFPSPLAVDGAYRQPVFVRALRPTDRDEWLVPIVRGGQVDGVVVVVIYDNGMGSAGIATGWSGRFPHPFTPEQAAAKVGTSSDPATSVELVWATIDPRQGGPATEFLPLYVATLRSGARWYVFQSGSIRDATQVDVVR